eukprot:TRINITY_DN90263_c0_g1_i1.p1 TRINITY_DN90263_c0_g1~~TRINITY_DN90263_c0_g1_i1.p1  ORF type:complete len:993 (-),score=171.68 TRINITY_DN90263_c0_g1_i1:68-3046(-)
MKPPLLGETLGPSYGLSPPPFLPPHPLLQGSAWQTVLPCSASSVSPSRPPHLPASWACGAAQLLTDHDVAAAGGALSPRDLGEFGTVPISPPSWSLFPVPPADAAWHQHAGAAVSLRHLESTRYAEALRAEDPFAALDGMSAHSSSCSSVCSRGSKRPARSGGQPAAPKGRSGQRRTDRLKNESKERDRDHTSAVEDPTGSAGGFPKKDAAGEPQVPRAGRRERCPETLVLDDHWQLVRKSPGSDLDPLSARRLLSLRQQMTEAAALRRRQQSPASVDAAEEPPAEAAATSSTAELTQEEPPQHARLQQQDRKQTQPQSPAWEGAAVGQNDSRTSQQASSSPCDHSEDRLEQERGPESEQPQAVSDNGASQSMSPIPDAEQTSAASSLEPEFLWMVQQRPPAKLEDGRERRRAPLVVSPGRHRRADASPSELWALPPDIVELLKKDKNASKASNSMQASGEGAPTAGQAPASSRYLDTTPTSDSRASSSGLSSLVYTKAAEVSSAVSLSTGSDRSHLIAHGRSSTLTVSPRTGRITRSRTPQQAADAPAALHRTQHERSSSSTSAWWDATNDSAAALSSVLQSSNAAADHRHRGSALFTSYLGRYLGGEGTLEVPAEVDEQSASGSSSSSAMPSASELRVQAVGRHPKSEARDGEEEDDLHGAAPPESPMQQVVHQDPAGHGASNHSGGIRRHSVLGDKARPLTALADQLSRGPVGQGVEAEVSAVSSGLLGLRRSGRRDILDPDSGGEDASYWEAMHAGAVAAPHGMEVPSMKSPASHSTLLAEAHSSPSVVKQLSSGSISPANAAGGGHDDTGSGFAIAAGATGRMKAMKQLAQQAGKRNRLQRHSLDGRDVHCLLLGDAVHPAGAPSAEPAGVEHSERRRGSDAAGISGSSVHGLGRPPALAALRSSTTVGEFPAAWAADPCRALAMHGQREDEEHADVRLGRLLSQMYARAPEDDASLVPRRRTVSFSPEGTSVERQPALSRGMTDRL